MRSKQWGSHYITRNDTPAERYKRFAEANRKAIELYSKAELPEYPEEK